MESTGQEKDQAGHVLAGILRGHAMVHDLRDPNDPQGRSYLEVNLSKKHTIPVGTLVEASWKYHYQEGAWCEFHGYLWVVKHTRDCDGTPLYSLGGNKQLEDNHLGTIFHGFTEDRLIVVGVTKCPHCGGDLKEGDGVETPTPYCGPCGVGWDSPEELVRILSSDDGIRQWVEKTFGPGALGRSIR